MLHISCQIFAFLAVHCNRTCCSSSHLLGQFWSSCLPALSLPIYTLFCDIGAGTQFVFPLSPLGSGIGMRLEGRLKERKPGGCSLFLSLLPQQQLAVPRADSSSFQPFSHTQNQPPCDLSGETAPDELHTLNPCLTEYPLQASKS